LPDYSERGKNIMTKTVKLLIIIASAAVILGLILGAAGFFIFGIDREPLEEFNKSYDAAITGIYIDVDIADVRIYKTEGDKIEVAYYDNDNNYFTLEERDSELHIKRKSPLYWFGSLNWFGSGIKYELEIGIPESFYGTLWIESDVGDIKVTELTLTDCKLSSSTGNIDCESVICSESFSASVSTGKISITSVTAKTITAKSNTGNINGKSIICSERFNASLNTGSISITDIEAKSITACSDTGGIKIKRMTVSESIYLETDTGDIYGSVTDGIGNYTIASDTDVGDNNLPGNLTGGSKKLEVYTDTGDIEFDFNK